ncbi:lantibiotic dehydratase [Kitasatospora atroaurantiaca]|uniref:Thiopeptide-type bacteriocin biosynthesis protein n=1 Tax=Kitasatospora atroaurantiaca TaxID=285545 RepID=A0A561ENC0_9ACTN|nr:lantibiotic dehydratase [Kitasatospora atroaurantiaca]TWE17105.1 thiopeptide-type bacteriocin biosynthesis protein [Kitasatospora atroaurantiaca]
MNARSLYQHSGTALLRAAAAPLTSLPDWWPDPADPASCRTWMEEVWSDAGFAAAIREASTSLAERIDGIVAGQPVKPKQVRRAAVAAARYLLRATGRPTPFGLFAGVAHATTGPTPDVRWGTGHRPVARADTEWLSAVIDKLEADPALLDRLDVVFNNLATQRGGRLQITQGGPNRVSIRRTSVIRFVQDAAATPARFAALADKLAQTASVEQSKAAGLLTELVRQGFLITSLRAPLTVTDPLAYAVDRLHQAGAAMLPATAPVLVDLAAIQEDLHRHNHADPGSDLAGEREAIRQRMRRLATDGRTPLALDLVLDCDARLPTALVRELERAASALLRLTRQPTGDAVWRNYHSAFWERYSTGSLVPLTELLDPATGLGYPAEYPGSTMTPPTRGPNERDERLLALAWRALADGSREIILTDETIDTLAGDLRFDARLIAPHVEISARVHAADLDALRSGDYRLTVAPARAAGTLTSRFSVTATGAGLAEVYRGMPTLVEGALPAQLSFPALFPHSENVTRVPAYLPHVMALGEHRPVDDGAEVIAVDDLAVTATRDRLYLVSISRRRIVEPQVFHALALDKQTPPIARFLAHLTRAFSPSWTGFDWGPHTRTLPYLPRVRYGRTVLAPARWLLTPADLTDLTGWRSRWQCPDVVELRDDDRTLRLALDEPLHVAILTAHLEQAGQAFLTETATAEDSGWLGGHAHEIAVPLARSGPGAPSPLAGSLPRIDTRTHGTLPGIPAGRWVNAKIPSHPEYFTEIITAHLPQLLASLDQPPCWFVRYRSPNESDHLRLRLRVPDGGQGEVAEAVGRWGQRLRDGGLAGGLSLDTYTPEIGRYGNGPALEAAERVFTADSRLVIAQLRHLPPATVHPSALVALNMVHIAEGFLGPGIATGWLAARPVAPAVADRAVTDQVVPLVRFGSHTDSPGWTAEIAAAFEERAKALAAYRQSLPDDADADAVLESLLHMHHNRAVGLDPGGEKVCRHLARQAARARQAAIGGER